MNACIVYYMYVIQLLSIINMFDSDFEDVYTHQFPKTDINFYMMENNSIALQPWNKTTYKIRPDSKHTIKRNSNKQKNFSFDSQERASRLFHRRTSTGIKHQVTLATLTFYLSVSQSKNHQRKKNSTSTMLKTRRGSHIEHQTPKQEDQCGLFTQDLQNRGFTNSLRHNNLLKLRHEHQSKVKDIISKKELINRGNLIRLNRSSLSKQGAFVQINTNNIQKLQVNNIILGEQPRVNAHQSLKKPKKPTYVGIRKVMNITDKQRPQP